MKRSFFIIIFENEFCPCSATVTPRRDESVKSTVERGEIRGGSLPPPEITERERRPRLWPLCQPGDNGMSLFPPCSRVDIAIESRPNCNWILRQTPTRLPAKKKKKAVATFGETRTYRFQFPTDNRDLFLSSITCSFLYFRWSGIKAPLKLISYNLYKYRTCGTNA